MAALDKILVEYELQLKKFKKQTDDMEKRLEDVEKTAQKSAEGASKGMDKFGASVKKIGGLIAGAFAVQKIVAFGAELVQIQLKAEGIQNAFAKLNNPALLAKLRKATRGTVGDLELMQTAVRARNFEIPLNQLAKLLEFARRRAKATGEDVDFLVNSLVDGLGKKSTQVLDNLGISANKLRKNMNGVSLATASVGEVAQAVGRIIDEDFAGSGEDVETLSEKVLANQVRWENLKLELSNNLLPVMTSVADIMLDIGEIATSEDIGFFEKMAAALIPGQVALTSATVKAAALKRETEALNEGTVEQNKEVKEVVISIELLKSEYAALKKELEQVAIGTKEEAQVVALATAKHNELNAALQRQEDIRNRIFDAQKQQIEPLEEQAPEQLDVDDPAADSLKGLETLEQAIMSSEERLAEFRANQRKFSEEELIEGTMRITEEAETHLQAFSALSSAIGAANLAQLEKDLANKTISEEQFAKRKAAIEKRQARISKSVELFKAVIGTARAIAEAAPNIPLIALAAATGAASIATIAAQPIPKFAKGVVQLDGNGTETSDSIPAMLSKNESVITAAGTKQDVGLMRAANKLQLKDYINENYVLPELAKAGSMNQSEAEMLQSIGTAIGGGSDIGIRTDLKGIKNQSKINTNKLADAFSQAFKEHPRNP